MHKDYFELIDAYYYLIIVAYFVNYLEFKKVKSYVIKVYGLIEFVRNRQVVFSGGQRPQYIVTCTGDNIQENPLTGGEIHIYKYTSNTPPQTRGGSTTLSLESNKSCCALVCAFVKKSANCKSEGTY
jgi:hypothetical protein